MIPERWRLRPVSDQWPATGPLPRPAVRDLVALVATLITAALLLVSLSGYHTGFLPLNALGSTLADGFWAGLTLLGDTRVALALMLLFVFRHPQLLAAILIAAVPATLVVHGLKDALNLPRPAGVLSPEQFHLIDDLLKAGSFPSGHSATAGVIAGLLLLIAPSRRLRLLVVGMMLLVAGSRVMVGAHWPVDVLAGASIGLLSALLGYWLSSRYRLCRRALGQWLLVALLVYAAVSVFFEDGGYPQGHVFAAIAAGAALLRYLLQLFGQPRTGHTTSEVSSS